MYLILIAISNIIDLIKFQYLIFMHVSSYLSHINLKGRENGKAMRGYPNPRIIEVRFCSVGINPPCISSR